MARYLIPLGIFIALVALFAAGLKLDPRKVPSPLVDKPAPEFSIPMLKSPQQQLGNKQLKGNVYLFNIWASWCVSCREEHPVLINLSRTGEVDIYGLNYKDQRTEALRWLKHFGDPYKASAYDVDGRVGIDWGVYGVPETFVIDAQGVIRYKHIGPLTQADVNDTILPLVRKLKGNSN